MAERMDVRVARYFCSSQPF
ncbi:hypothetical protein CCACVL1_23903 [Corchorus capsularis]|uniref:Uncharacterized protein n=1 Tax=Corchorus capsularis TaxID=210143 RepID=A0A1R3GRK3_COCAP|nr:hypothetical protein CCACVL1_23903 [Corchorus capsularis]